LIVWKAELAEIMEVAEKPPVGTKRGPKPGAGGLALTIQRDEGHKRAKTLHLSSAA
jgi:hypothetical protein